MQEKPWLKQRIPKFKALNDIHVKFLKDLMQFESTRHYTID